MLDVSQKNIIKSLWNADDLSISDKINSIDSISKEMPLEARKEYRKWRFLMNGSRVNQEAFLSIRNANEILDARFLRFPKWRGQDEDSQNIWEIYRFRLFNYLRNITYLLFLEGFARAIMNIKPVLNNPDAFDNWVKNEEIEFKKPPIQENMKEESTSQSVSYYVRLTTFYLIL